jgi:hypothetical protein
MNTGGGMGHGGHTGGTPHTGNIGDHRDNNVYGYVPPRATDGNDGRSPESSHGSLLDKIIEFLFP